MIMPTCGACLEPIEQVVVEGPGFKVSKLWVTSSGPVPDLIGRPLTVFNGLCDATRGHFPMPKRPKEQELE
jgi:hypothetical protein